MAALFASGCRGSGDAAGKAGAVRSFSCIDGWPARPAPVRKAAAAPLAVAPGLLWTKALPSNAIVPGMAATGRGVAVTSGDRLVIYDGAGQTVATVHKPQRTGAISAPVAGPDGSVYFADASHAYRVDAAGRPVWEKPLGESPTVLDFAAPRPPALDPAGRLHVSALDGKLWTIRASDGQVMSSVSIGLWKSAPRSLDRGIENVLFVDWEGKAAAGPGIAAEAMLSAETGKLLGEIVVGDGRYPPSVMAGPDIGLVLSAYSSLDTETTTTMVVDRCGELRWRVPGDHAVPIALTFDDDLIVMDRAPSAQGPRRFSLRRFSRDGKLVAGPVSAPDQFCGKAFVGADDTLYYTTWSARETRLVAFDASLKQVWSVPFPSCPDAAVLNADGKIFAAAGGAAGLAAFQTTSPGPARVSWSQAGGDARATRWLTP